MTDYISREAAIEAFKNADADVVEDYGDGYCDCGFGLVNAIKILNSIPAADAEPVRHEQWEGYVHSWFSGFDEYGAQRFADGAVYYCSNPECRRKTVIRERYCPSCGAKMDLEGKNENRQSN